MGGDSENGVRVGRHSETRVTVGEGSETRMRVDGHSENEAELVRAVRLGSEWLRQ